MVAYDLPVSDSDTELLCGTRIAGLGELSMSARCDPCTYTIALAGELDVDSSAAVQRELLRAERTDALTIVLDLSHVTFVDSSAIKLLLAASARSRAGQHRLQLRRPPAGVLQVLQRAGVDRLLPFVA